jgi:hypothetical protein
MFSLQNQTLEERTNGIYMALPKVILTIHQSNRISQMDFESAQRIIRGSMLQFPDLYFVFLSNDINTFEDMVNDNSDERISSGRMVSIFLFIIEH